MARAWVQFMGHSPTGTNSQILVRFAGPDVDPFLQPQEHQCDYAAGANYTQIRQAVEGCVLNEIAPRLGLTVQSADILVPSYS